METAIIYSRVSTQDKQDNFRAIDDLKKYAQYKGYKVVKIFEEKISGMTKGSQREEFSKLLKYIDEHKVNHLLVWEISRLGRGGVADVSTIVEKFTEKGINIYFKKEELNTIKNGKKDAYTDMIIAVFSAVASMERETFTARSKSGIRANVARGGSGTGINKPYGFKKVGKTLQVDEEEAEIVKWMFKRYLEGAGTPTIAKELNEQNIPTRFNKIHSGKEIKQKYGIMKDGSLYTWKDGTVYTILTNTIYKGERVHKDEIFKIEPIVEPKIFDDVQEKLEKGFNKKNTNKKYENPLKDLLRCGKCGRSYFLHKRADGKDNAFKCISKRYGEYCGNTAINYDKLLKALYWTCQPIIYNDSVDVNSQTEKLLKGKLKECTGRLEKVKKEIVDIGKQQDNLVKLNLTGKITIKQFSTNNDQLLNELEKRQQQQGAIEDEIKKINHQLNRKKPEQGYNYTIFSGHIKEAVESIKVYEVAKQDRFKEMFQASNDVAVLIEVKSNLVTPDDVPIYYHFVLSRYSKNIGIVQFEKDDVTDYNKEIAKGRYHLDLFLLLDKMEQAKYMKNPYFKKKK